MCCWIFSRRNSVILTRLCPAFHDCRLLRLPLLLRRWMHRRRSPSRKNFLLLCARLDSVLVAFSGGADSAYLAWSAHQALGERALAITALSASFSRHDREQAEAFIAATGLRHEFIETRELENPLYVANNADRCYHCKDELFDQMDALARTRGLRRSPTESTRTTRAISGPAIARRTNITCSRRCSTRSSTRLRFVFFRNELVWLPGIVPLRLVFRRACPMARAVTPELLEKIDRAEAVLRALEFPAISRARAWRAGAN